MKTVAVGVNLHSLMVRFSFMRDCGSIPHGNPLLRRIIKLHFDFDLEFEFDFSCHF